MEYRKLGLTDLKISRIGFGCWAIGGHGYGMVDDRQSIEAIQKGVDTGINFFDTADVYGLGHSESILSKALGAKRNQVVIASKFGVAWDASGRTYKDCSPKRVVEALEGSLRRLKIDCIPLYQIHCYDGKTPIWETMEALKRCQKAGKIRYIGCSNFSSQLLLEANKVCRIESIQLLYNLAQRELEPDILKSSHGLKMGVIAYSVLGRGVFSGKYSWKSEFGKNDTRCADENFQGVKIKKNLQLVDVLKKISGSYGKTPAQIAISWVLSNPGVTCALTGIKNPQQAVENSRTVGWKLLLKDSELLAGKESRTKRLLELRKQEPERVINDS